MEQDKTQVLICDCYSPEHHVFLFYDEEDKQVFVNIHLTKKKFWNRLKYGIKYIFGYAIKSGAYQEIVLSNKDAEKIENVLKFLKEK